jgi:hypothetical protein
MGAYFTREAWNLVQPLIDGHLAHQVAMEDPIPWLLMRPH